MQYYRCKCGNMESWSSMGPTRCAKCEKCGSNFAGGPGTHSDPEPHKWFKEIVATDDGPKELTRCQYCLQTKVQIENPAPPKQKTERDEWQEAQHDIYLQMCAMIGVDPDKPPTWPHCDARVLHAPQRCTICDEYATDLQQRRVTAGMNFTGENDPDKLPDPAILSRPLETINRWGGNVARG